MSAGIIFALLGIVIINRSRAPDVCNVGMLVFMIGALIVAGVSIARVLP